MCASVCVATREKILKLDRLLWSKTAHRNEQVVVNELCKDQKGDRKDCART